MSADTVEKLITNAIHTAFLNTQRAMAARTLTMTGFRSNRARILPKRFFWIWQPADFKS